jgi:arylformamidase
MRIIDLSRPIYDGMPVFSGDPEVRVEILGAPEADNGVVRRISLGSHTGTHVDAFSHMHRDGECLGDIPLERFLGPARAVRPEERLPKGVGLIFVEAPPLEDARRIAQARPPFVAGDLPAELERILLARHILTYTDLVNLDQLPEGVEFTFYGLPLSISDGDGSPVRAVAIIP